MGVFLRTCNGSKLGMYKTAYLAQSTFQIGRRSKKWNKNPVSDRWCLGSNVMGIQASTSQCNPSLPINSWPSERIILVFFFTPFNQASYFLGRVDDIGLSWSLDPAKELMSLMEKGCAGRSGGKVEMQGKEPCGGLFLLLLLLLLFSFPNLSLELHS